MRVRWGKSTRWSSDVAGLLDWHVDGDALHVMLLWSAVRAARKDVSIGTATWTLNGAQYQTSMVSVLPGEGLMRVSARETERCAE